MKPLHFQEVRFEGQTPPPFEIKPDRQHPVPREGRITYEAHGEIVFDPEGVERHKLLAGRTYSFEIDSDGRRYRFAGVIAQMTEDGGIRFELEPRLLICSVPLPESPAA